MISIPTWIFVVMIFCLVSDLLPYAIKNAEAHRWWLFALNIACMICWVIVLITQLIINGACQ